MHRYQQRISGPLLDRIDIHIEVPRLPHDDLMQTAPSECSQAVRQRVVEARTRQQERLTDTGATCNAHMRPQDLRKHCLMTEDARALLKVAAQRMGISARAFDRITKLGRTIADLADCDVIEPAHIAEAIQYRSLDRRILS